MTVVRTIPYVKQGIDIQARIIKNSEEKFSWELSHRYQALQNSGIHHVGAIWSEDISQVEENLEHYLKGFDTAFKIVENPNY